MTSLTRSSLHKTHLLKGGESQREGVAALRRLT